MRIQYIIPWIRWSCSKFVAFKALSTFSSKEFMAMIIICPEVMDPVLLFKVWIKSRNDFSASGWLMMSLICLAACSIAPSSRWQFFKPVKVWKKFISFRVTITKFQRYTQVIFIESDALFCQLPKPKYGFSNLTLVFFHDWQAGLLARWYVVAK